MSTMPESVPGPTLGAIPPDQPQARTVDEILAELDAALWQDRQLSRQEMRSVRMFFEVTQMKIQAYQAGQPVGPGLDIAQPPEEVAAEPEAAPEEPGEPVDAWGAEGEPVNEGY